MRLPDHAEHGVQGAEPDEGSAGEPEGRLTAYLRAHDVDAALVYPGRETPTVPAAAAALGVTEGQIVKSLLFQGKDGDTVLVIARGTAKIDRRRLAVASGLRKPQLAPPDVALRVTGYPPGGTPPVGHVMPVRVLLDVGVLEEPVVYGGGGRVDAMLRIKPADIQRLTRAEVAELCQDEG